MPETMMKQQDVRKNFTWELARYSIPEELVPYPAFEQHLGSKGKEMAAKDRAGHKLYKQGQHRDLLVSQT